MSTLSVVARRLVWGRAVSGGRWVQIGYVLADLFFVGLSAVAVFYFRFVPGWWASLIRGEVPTIPEYPFLDEYLAFLFLYGSLIVLFCQSQDLYRTLRTRSGLDESLAVAKAVALATLLLTVFIYLSGVKSVSRLVVGGSGVLSLVALAAWRLWKRQVVERSRQSGGSRDDPSARSQVVDTRTVGFLFARVTRDHGQEVAQRHRLGEKLHHAQGLRALPVLWGR